MISNGHRISYYVINGITMYRLVSAPFLIVLAALGELNWFKWLVALSFFTDAIDGPLSRRYQVTSVFGARLDSVADDATVVASTVGLWLIHPEFIQKEWVMIASVFGLFGIQTAAALVAYKKVTSFHTYLAKSAAVAQGLFFMMILFNIQPFVFMFYLAGVLTSVQLIEEIILIILLPEWKANVSGLYWVLRDRFKKRAKA